MFAGTDLILGCPHCQAVARLFIPEIEQAPDMITWTDGWQTSPELERPPRVTRCGSCGRTYWVGEAEQLGFLAPEMHADPSKAAWAAAPLVPTLDEAGVRQALAEGLGSFSELELELRVLQWWRGNDAFRNASAPLGYSTSPEAVANIERMVEMTADGAEDLLLFRAEAQRQMGDFAAAEATLQGVGCSDYWPAKRRLLDLLAVQSRKLDILFLPLPQGEAEAAAGEQPPLPPPAPAA